METRRNPVSELMDPDWYMGADRRCRQRLTLLGVDGTLGEAVVNMALDLAIAAYQRGVRDGERKAKGY